MPTITIDGREVEVAQGGTILDGARKLGIDVPALCFLEGYAPSTSCLVCMVKICGPDKLVPSCGTVAADGMVVESETEEVHQVRRTALELLLSDHVGDCLAPCWFGCPAHMDIPLMLREIAGGRLSEAIATVKRDIALPAVLGRICPAPCEGACRRRPADGAVAICGLKRYVADVDLGSETPYLPDCRPSSGKRVAIVGGGPTGLAAAYYLARRGHAATVFDDQPELGGRLRRETTDKELPRDVLDREIALVTDLGVEVHVNTPVGEEPSLEEIRSEADAVLVACGRAGQGVFERWGLEGTARGVQVDRETWATNLEGVFAAGSAIRAKGLVIRSVADGKEVALAMDEHLAGGPVSRSKRAFSSRMGKLDEEELALYLAGAGEAPRREAGSAGFADEEAVRQAERCLRCDCRALASCKLKRYAERYDADPKRYQEGRAPFAQSTQHSLVIYEPGKCIRCGLCIEIAAEAKEPLGLAFIGRGFDVRVGVPFDGSMAEALSKVAAECVAACPTAALALKDEAHR